MAVQDEIPKSRITLRYRTKIDGEAKDIDLPLRFMVLGDLTNNPERGPIEEREVHAVTKATLPSVFENLGGARVKLNLPAITGDADEEVQLEFKSIRDFEPDKIAESVPSIRSLVLTRQLLTELQASLSNRRALRNKLVNVVRSQQTETLRSTLSGKGYDSFRLPKPEQLLGKPADGTEETPASSEEA
ncbi:MAG: type VI secretion system contractile sheath small subunit [Myxococcota bacterium]